ncbi:DMT family transporter [Conexibacter sp. S30A1]|jgi:DME family drug/metabolite transporter|uniref:DMT family transporter n=1 Tax=Conexibacter sp. S30A1 TaxID=2937800 RepID=UPI00200CD6CA|nr:EamA family transporter [Conexibacter sp. S30A1]
MNESSTAESAIARARTPVARRASAERSAPALRANAGTWSVLGAAVLWGTTGTAATFAPRSASSLAIGAAAMGIGGIALFLGARRAALRLITTRAGGRALWLGAGFVVAYPLAFYTSMADAGVAVGVTLSIGAAPIAAALIERFRHGRRLTRRWVATVAIALLGAALLGTGRAELAHHMQLLVGVILALTAACCYAGYTVAASDIIARSASSRATVGALFGLGSLVLIPILLITGSTLLTSSRGILVAGYLGLIPMTIGYVLFGHGLRTTTARDATLLSLLEPAVAAALAALVAHQHLSPLGWLGLGLVLASVLLQTRSNQRGATNAPAAAP